jgi:predicted nucleic acid-binding protein
VPEQELDLALGDAARVLLDSNSLIAFHSTQQQTHALARHILARVQDPHDRLIAYYSAVTAMELLVRPIQAGAGELAYMHTFLTGFPNLTFLPVDFMVAQRAATVRATTRLKAPDALIVATGLLAGCEAIVHNDHAWETKLKPHFPMFRWIYLNSYRQRVEREE